jgi:hypothetical protein
MAAGIGAGPAGSIDCGRRRHRPLPGWLPSSGLCESPHGSRSERRGSDCAGSSRFGRPGGCHPQSGGGRRAGRSRRDDRGLGRVPRQVRPSAGRNRGPSGRRHGDAPRAPDGAEQARGCYRAAGGCRDTGLLRRTCYRRKPPGLRRLHGPAPQARHGWADPDPLQAEGRQPLDIHGDRDRGPVGIFRQCKRPFVRPARV